MLPQQQKQWNKYLRSMDLHDLETPEWESYTNEGTQHRDEPITTAQNQPITAEHNASPVDE